MQQTLAQLVRAKYPGAYDDLSDQQLESSVKAKYPGQYDDLPSSSAKPKPERASGLATLGDFVIGALKGGGETAINLGAMLHKIPGVSSVVDSLYGEEGLSQGSFPAARAGMAPTNTAQRVGRGTEKIAEMLAPAGIVSRAGQGAATAVRTMLPAQGIAARALPMAANMAVQGTAGAAQSVSQGGSGTVGGVLSAGIPVVGKYAAAIPSNLKGQAAKQVMQALGPTKERYKAMAAKITPEMLSRGLSGSREALKEQSAEMVAKLGPQIDNAIAAYGSRTASTKPILDALEASKAPFQVAVAGGKSPVAAAIRSNKTVPLDARALDQIDSLQKVVSEIGETATVEQLVGVRRAWDKIVSQAGGYQQRAAGAIGVPLADQSEAAVKREGAKAIRKVLDAEVPELTAINKEYAFWRSLDDILGQTLSRTQPQSEGLGRKIAQGTGAAVGAFTGSSAGPMGIVGGFAMGGAAAKMLERAVTSPAWRLTSAKLKDRLADALASGKPARIAEATSRILAIQSSQVGR